MKWSNHASSGANFKHGDAEDKRRDEPRNARKRLAEATTDRTDPHEFQVGQIVAGSGMKQDR